MKALYVMISEFWKILVHKVKELEAILVNTKFSCPEATQGVSSKNCKANVETTTQLTTKAQVLGPYGTAKEMNGWPW